MGPEADAMVKEAVVVVVVGMAERGKGEGWMAD